MNGQLKWEESDLKNLVPNFDLITENSRWKKSTLIKAVIAAVGGRDNMIAQSKQRQSKLFESKLGSDLEASNPSYVKGKRRELYDWNKNKGQWIPKEEAIHNFSKEWRLPKENVESIMLNRIKMAGIRDSAPGAGLINDQFLPYQNSILQWHRDHIFIDRGLGDSFDSTNPRKTLKGGQIYDSLSGPQQDAIDTMITELEDLKSLTENRYPHEPDVMGECYVDPDILEQAILYTDCATDMQNNGHACAIYEDIEELDRIMMYELGMKPTHYEKRPNAKWSGRNYQSVKAARNYRRKQLGLPKIPSIKTSNLDKQLAETNERRRGLRPKLKFSKKELQYRAEEAGITGFATITPMKTKKGKLVHELLDEISKKKAIGQH